ncbi:MAG: hypothetical protein C0483_24980 [Pirellula sp.]|nr:hypothetical protein [Pirellula sp.]
MPITILCPNGHKLTCPDSLAGKAGKCPHCGAKFRIPEKSSGPGSGPKVNILTGPAAAAAAPAMVAEAPVAEPVAEASVAAPVESDTTGIRSLDADGAGEPRSDEVVFMCPEGHHLCGPATLVGQPGECPVCHERFLVPSSEEESDPSTPELQLSAMLASAEAPQGFSFNGGDEGGAKGIGALFAELWKYRALGSAVELHLDSGVLVPNGFAPESAGLSHGVFTLAEPNGAATLSVIAWSAIQRINVRGLYSLPRGVEFDVPQ